MNQSICPSAGNVTSGKSLNPGVHLHFLICYLRPHLTAFFWGQTEPIHASAYNSAWHGKCYYYCHHRRRPHHPHVVGTLSNIPSTKLRRRVPGATRGCFPGCPRALRTGAGGEGSGCFCITTFSPRGAQRSLLYRETSATRRDEGSLLLPLGHPRVQQGSTFYSGTI